MLKKILISLLIGLMTTGLFALADGTDSDKSPVKDSNKSDKSKSEMDGDLEELNQELKPEPVPEEVDVLSLLKQIQERMTDAADGLSKASIWKATEKQGQTITDINEVLKRQKEALEQLNKSLHDTKKKQQEAIDNINKLIKAASQSQQSSSGSSQQQNKPQSSKPQQPKNGQENKKPGEPATKPYEATAQPPGTGRHTSGTTDRWGNLPPKIRDAIILSKPEEFTMEYQQWLERYFKILAEEQK